jgi:heme exporter protein D
MNDFLAMSGYGKYLWPAFGLGFGVVVLIYVSARSSLSSAMRDARRRLEINRPEQIR